MAKKHSTKSTEDTLQTDVLVVGTGLAGLVAALKLAEKKKVILLSKSELQECNSAMAQGGIAAVMAKEDSFASHVQDTMNAGAHCNEARIVSQIVEQAPERIHELMKWGVQFDLSGNRGPEALEYDLTREGGHSHRRIVHAHDQTGKHIHGVLLEKASQHPNIRILSSHFAVDLLTSRHLAPPKVKDNRCWGAYVLNKKTSKVIAIKAPITILATGGAGKVYLYTSNWSGATGDGIAMAHRAGARVLNLEFMQFHPTCLYHPEARNFLISEALRGEGGELINQKGEAFMKSYHPLGALAPRDIVARSIDAEMKKTGAPCVFLDMTHLDSNFTKTRFPSIYESCLRFGIDITKAPIPVVPAAHYLCGGVLADEFGQTDIEGLFALGETACTGFHGANRLASNSLLECLAMAHNCSQFLLNQQELFSLQVAPLVPNWIYPKENDADELIVVHHMWDEIRHLMWNYVGIVRSNKRLLRAQVRLQNIQNEVREYYSHFQIHSDILELRNIALVAELTVQGALKRKESVGIHYSLDYPPK